MFLMLGVTSVGWAQGTAQVQFVGLPSQLSSVGLNTIEQDYRTGRYPVQFIYNDPTGESANFRFRFEVEYNGQPVLNVISDPVTYQPGVYLYQTFQDPPRVRFSGGYPDLLRRLDAGLLRRINATGRLPEGEYVITLEVESMAADRLIATLPAQHVVSVRIAEPPVLISPQNGALVTAPTPQFAWTPATGLPAGVLPDYILRIVEIKPGQNKLTAIEGNIPQVDDVISGRSTFTYLPNQLPLQNGKRYAWQIRATEPTGQINFADDGTTEIYTFTYGDIGIDRYVWTYPSENNPLIRIPIPEYAKDDMDRLTVSGEFAGTVNGESVWANFGSESNAAEFQVTGTPPDATLELTRGAVRLSNGMTITPGN